MARLYGKTAYPGKVEAQAVSSPGEEGVLVLEDALSNLMLVPGKTLGLAIKKGGVLCHGAVLAREFRIPCVVGVDLTEYSGKVVLNATEGFVETVD